MSSLRPRGWRRPERAFSASVTLTSSGRYDTVPVKQKPTTATLYRVIGGLLMSGRRPKSDSGEPDLWSNGSVFMEPSEPISIDPSPHIPLQQTTVIPSPFERDRIRAADTHGRASHTSFPRKRESRKRRRRRVGNGWLHRAFVIHADLV
jgi:hypothetical protein